MSDNLDKFFTPSPEELAHRNAIAEIREEAGRLKTKLRNELRGLRRKKTDSLIPSERATLEEQIGAKQKEFDEVDCVFSAATTERQKATQDCVKRLIHWDEIAAKYGVKL